MLQKIKNKRNLGKNEKEIIQKWLWLKEEGKMKHIKNIKY